MSSDSFLGVIRSPPVAKCRPLDTLCQAYTSRLDVLSRGRCMLGVARAFPSRYTFWDTYPTQLGRRPRLGISRWMWGLSGADRCISIKIRQGMEPAVWEMECMREKKTIMGSTPKVKSIEKFIENQSSFRSEQWCWPSSWWRDSFYLNHAPRKPVYTCMRDLQSSCFTMLLWSLNPRFTPFSCSASIITTQPLRCAWVLL